MQEFIIYGGSAVVILLLVVSFLVSHAKMLARKKDSEWEILRDMLSLRHDYLPSLIETARALAPGQDGMLKELMAARDKAAHTHQPGLVKIEAEMALSKAISAVVGLAKQFPAFQRDTNFLELRQDLQKSRGDVEQLTLAYNKAVRRYNRFVGTPFLIPLLRPLKFVRGQIFEFE